MAYRSICDCVFEGICRSALSIRCYSAGIVGIVAAYSMAKLFKQNKLLNDSLLKTNEYFKKVKAAG